MVYTPLAHTERDEGIGYSIVSGYSHLQNLSQDVLLSQARAGCLRCPRKIRGVLD